MVEHIPPPSLILFDIDGTLTDARTFFGGRELGWVQLYSVRDGEAILRLKATGLQLAPLSRNSTESARARMEWLGMNVSWLGVKDKMAAYADACQHFAVRDEQVWHVGDGVDDIPVMEKCGLSIAVADAHPRVRDCAKIILKAAGGGHVFEEVEMIRNSADGLKSGA